MIVPLSTQPHSSVPDEDDGGVGHVQGRNGGDHWGMVSRRRVAVKNASRCSHVLQPLSRKGNITAVLLPAVTTGEDVVGHVGACDF